MKAGLGLVLALFVGSHALAQSPQRFARHDVWEKARAEAEKATASGDLTTAREQTLLAFREAVLFAESDPRLAQTSAALDSLQEKLIERGDADAVDGLLVSIQQLADSAGAGATRVAVEVNLRRSDIAGRTGDAASAERLAAAARERAEARFGAAHQLTLQAGAKYVDAVAARDPRRAILLASTQIDTLTAALGPENPMVVSAHITLAMVHLHAGEARLGLGAISHALELATKRTALGAMQGTVLWVLGIAQSSLGEHKRAEESLRNAREQIELLLGLESDMAASAGGALAQARFALGDLQGGFEALDRAAAALRKTGGADAPKLADPLMAEAAVLAELGDLDAADRLLVRASELATRAGAFGREDALKVRWSQAHIASKRGDPAPTLALHAELTAKPARTFSEKMRLCASSNQVAYALGRERRFAEALPHAERAVRCMEELFDPNSENLAPATDTLAWIQFGTGRTDEARDSFRRVS